MQRSLSRGAFITATFKYKVKYPIDSANIFYLTVSLITRLIVGSSFLEANTLIYSNFELKSRSVQPTDSCNVVELR